MPTKKKSSVHAVPLAVPDLGDDSVERKRVLNVLAQRRYRQKRKEHIRKLEAQATVAEVVQDASPPPSNDTAQRIPEDFEVEDGVLNVHCPFANALLPFDDSQLKAVDIDLEAQPLASPGGLFANILPDDPELWDTSILLPSLPSTPLSTSRHSSSTESDTWCLTPPSATKSPNEWLTPPLLSEEMTYSFPDEAYLAMTELTLLRGCMAIATRLNIQDTIWTLAAQSPFTNPAMGLGDFDHLPANLRPTLLQMTLAHHPVIDLLPWPSARDRMIKILTQPAEFRPPGAASPMALLDFVYDLEDCAEGTRITGNDPYSANNWEVGEKVFASWWWIFDRDIIKRSNELRASRGAPMLGGSIMGEVA